MSMIKNRFNIVAITGSYIIMATILFGLVKCVMSRKAHVSDEFTAIKIVHNFEDFIIVNNEPRTECDSAILIHYKDLILYLAGYTFQETFTTLDTNWNIIDEKILDPETRYTPFVYKKDHVWGLKFDSLTSKHSRIFPVDSLLKEKTFKEGLFAITENDSLVYSGTDENNIFLEKYIPRIKYDLSYSDTSFFYYSSELNHIDYSFSKKLDSTKKMKLFRVRHFYKQAPKGAYPVDLPDHEYLFEFKKTQLTNQQQILDFLKRVIASNTLPDN
jgi:hypothetical protein